MYKYNNYIARIMQVINAYKNDKISTFCALENSKLIIYFYFLRELSLIMYLNIYLDFPVKLWRVIRVGHCVILFFFVRSLRKVRKWKRLFRSEFITIP